jgi:hypothetical protein
VRGMSFDVDSLVVGQARKFCLMIHKRSNIVLNSMPRVLFFVVHLAVKGETIEIAKEIIGDDSVLSGEFQFKSLSRCFECF